MATSEYPGQFGETVRRGKPNGAGNGCALTLRYGYEAARPQPMGTVVEGLLHGGSLTLFYGPPKSGKSFLLTSCFLAIAAHDQAWMGQKIAHPGPVLYVACEGLSGFWKRLSAEAIKRGWTEHTFPKDFVLAVGRPRLVQISAKTRAAVPHPDDVLAALEEMKAKGIIPVAVAVDTVFKSIGDGSVNAPDHMNAYLAALSFITDQSIALAVVHRETKSGGTPVGSVSLIGGADTIVLTTNGANEGAHTWEVEMAKDDAETKPRSFSLQVVDVGPDADGEPQSSCVVRDDGWAPDAPKQELVGSQLLQAYDRLADAAEPSGGFAGETVRKVRLHAVRKELQRRGILDVDDKDRLTSTSRSAFHRAKTDLIARQRIVENDGMIWRIYPAQPVQ